MRILHIDTGREMRGGQRQALLLVGALRERGEQVFVLARANTPLHSRLKASGFEVGSATLVNVRRESEKADLVHAHDAKSHTLASLASQKPFVVSRRVAFPIHTSFLSVWKYRRAAAYLAVSNAVVNQLEAAHIPREKIHLVYDAIVPAAYNWSWKPGAPIVTFASNDPAKGADLIRAAAQLWGPAPILFSRDLASDLPEAAAFLYVTRSEGLGSAALLAMSMGVPVIASAVGGLLEILEHQHSGLHVSNDPHRIAEAVRCITSDRDLAERISRNGHDRVRRQFNLETMVRKTLDVYRSIL